MLRPKFPGTIRGTLLLLLLAVLLPVLIVQAGLHYGRFQERRAQEFESNLEIARAVGAAFDAFTDDVLRQDLAIGTGLASPQPLPREQIDRLLNQAVAQYPSMKYISWADPSGRIVISTLPQAVGAGLDDRPYFQAIAGGRESAVSDVLLGRVTGEPTFAVARGIRDPSGVLQGVVVAMLDPQHLGDVLGVQRVGRESISVIDSQGWGVYRYPEVDLGWEPRDWIKTEPAIASALAGKEATDTFLSPIDKQMRMSALVPIPSIGWVARATIPESEAMAPAISDLFRDLALLLLVGVVAFLVALAIGRRLPFPMSRLQEHALAIGRGDLGRRVEITGPAELEDLAAAFNRMSKELRAREDQQQRLLNEIQRRAAQLEAVIGGTHAQLALLDRNFNFVMVNARYAEGAECTREELVGRNHFALFPNAENQSIFERVRDTGEPYRAEEKRFDYAGRPEKGATYWNWTLVPIKDQVGRVEGLLLSLLDVTTQIQARQQVEALAEEANQRAAELEATISSVADGLVIYNPSGATLRMNPAAVRIFGYSTAEGSPSPADLTTHLQMQKSDGTPFPPDGTPSDRALRGETVCGEVMILASNGNATRWISASAAPIRSAEGRLRASPGGWSGCGA